MANSSRRDIRQARKAVRDLRALVARYPNLPETAGLIRDTGHVPLLPSREMDLLSTYFRLFKACIEAIKTLERYGVNVEEL